VTVTTEKMVVVETATLYVLFGVTMEVEMTVVVKTDAVVALDVLLTGFAVELVDATSGTLVELMVLFGGFIVEVVSVENGLTIDVVRGALVKLVDTAEMELVVVCRVDVWKVDD
jgi:hypothetical protein